MKKLRNIFLIMFLFMQALFFYQTVLADSVSNAGFIPANIWYSKDPFEEGDKIKVYTLVFNPDQRTLSGTVTFFDKSVFLGKKDFSVPGNGVKDISIDWTVAVGDHTVFAKIENAKFEVTKNKYEEIYLAENQTQKSNRTVSKKIIIKQEDVSTAIDGIPVQASGSVENIENLIKNKTPDFIAKPISSVIGMLEEYRQSSTNNTNKKKEDLKNIIKAEDFYKIPSDSSKSNNVILKKPLQYVKLFFLSVLSTFLANRIIFYGVLAILVFFILRFFWRRIF